MFEVLATSGNTHLGGEDFDQRIVKLLIEVFKKKHNHDVSNDKKAIQKLKRAAETAKRTLSSSHEARIEIDSLYNGIDFTYKLSRAKFEEISDDLFKKIIPPIQDALTTAKLTKEQIHEIVLVGGSTRIPKVQQTVKNFFGREPNKNINPGMKLNIIKSNP